MSRAVRGDVKNRLRRKWEAFSWHHPVIADVIGAVVWFVASAVDGLRHKR